MATAKTKTKKAPKVVKADPPPWPAGLTIVEVRPMTYTEASHEGWGIDNINGAPPGIVLSDGSKLYPARDPEGNGPGAMFGVSAGKHIRLA